MESSCEAYDFRSFPRKRESGYFLQEPGPGFARTTALSRPVEPCDLLTTGSVGVQKLLWLVVGYLMVINLLAFGMFALDKNAARQGSWRISEGTLLFSALAGGTLGAISAQQMLRHKTRKEPFRSLLYATALLQVARSSISI
jgi:uncharacterized membrane protein YsdA (DUF1294 family)